MSKKLPVHPKSRPKSEGSRSVPYKGTAWGTNKPNTAQASHNMNNDHSYYGNNLAARTEIRPKRHGVDA